MDGGVTECSFCGAPATHQRDRKAYTCYGTIENQHLCEHCHEADSPPYREHPPDCEGCIRARAWQEQKRELWLKQKQNQR